MRIRSVHQWALDELFVCPPLTNYEIHLECRVFAIEASVKRSSGVTLPARSRAVNDMRQIFILFPYHLLRELAQSVGKLLVPPHAWRGGKVEVETVVRMRVAIRQVS